MATLSVEAFEDILVGEDREARDAFLASLPRRVHRIARASRIAHVAIDQFGRYVPETERTRNVMLFLHGALNSVVSSTHLLIIGYPVASHHLMRQYGESCAMALLCADKKSGVHERLLVEPAKYPFHKSLDRISRADVSARLRALVGLDSVKWQQFRRLTEAYHHFSHASLFTMVHYVKDTKQGQLLILGSEYDANNRKWYSIELKRRRSALRSLATLARSLRRAMPQRTRPVPRAA